MDEINTNQPETVRLADQELLVPAEDILMDPSNMDEQGTNASAKAADSDTSEADASDETLPQQDSEEKKQSAAGDGEAAQEPDLLSQIAREDELDEERRKNRKSLYERFVHLLIQINLFLGALPKKSPLIFKTLNWIWRLFVGLILAGGFFALVVLIYIYVSFPKYVRGYLARNNVIADELSYSDFSFSHVEIKNVHDAKHTYDIKSIILQYTISDLLKRQIKSITLDGVKVFVTESDKGFDFGGLPQILLKMNQYNKRSDVHIASLGLTNAALEIKGQKFNFPISFSMTGIYEMGADVNIPIWIKEDSLTLKGSLSIKGKGGQLEWIIDISSGVLSLPGQLPENLSGRITFTTKNNTIQTVDGALKLFYGENLKQFNVKLKKKKDRLFAGALKLNLKEVNQYDKAKPVNSIITLSFDGIDFKNGIHGIESDQPIQVDIQAFKKNDFSVNNVRTRLLGKLKCENFACSYQLQAPSAVSATQARFMLNQNMVQTDRGVSFTLMPLKDRNIFEFKDGKINVDFVTQDMSLIGFKNVRTNRVAFQSKWLSVNGQFNMNAPYQNLALNIEGLNYQVPEYTLKGGTLQIDDLFATTPQLLFASESFTLNETELIKRPFAVVLNYKDQETNARMSLENGLIQVFFSGAINFITGEMSGSIYMPTVELKRLPVSLAQISSLFSPAIQRLSGQVAALGTINWLNAKQVSGPLYVSLKNVDAQVGNVNVRGLNTVMALASLEPLISQGSQQVFIRNLQSVVSLKNVALNYQLDNQFFYLTAFSGYLGNIELVADSALIPHRASNSTVVFRNNNVDMAGFANYLTFPVQLTGKASVNLPVELKNQYVSVRNGEIRFMNASIKRDKAVPQLADLLAKQKSYAVRNGLLLLNSVPNTQRMEIQVALDQKENKSNAAQRSFRKTYEVNLNSLIKPMKNEPVPAQILNKQQLFNF